jgi:formyl-CoA transferase
LTYYDLLHHDHVAANKMMLQIEHPYVGPFSYGALPFQFEKTPTTLTPSPLPGEHTQEVLDELGLSLDGPARTAEDTETATAGTAR